MSSSDDKRLIAAAILSDNYIFTQKIYPRLVWDKDARDRLTHLGKVSEKGISRDWKRKSSDGKIVRKYRVNGVFLDGCVTTEEQLDGSVLLRVWNGSMWDKTEIPNPYFVKHGRGCATIYEDNKNTAGEPENLVCEYLIAPSASGVTITRDGVSIDVDTQMVVAKPAKKTEDIEMVKSLRGGNVIKASSFKEIWDIQTNRKKIKVNDNYIKHANAVIIPFFDKIMSDAGFDWQHSGNGKQNTGAKGIFIHTETGYLIRFSADENDKRLWFSADTFADERVHCAGKGLRGKNVSVNLYDLYISEQTTIEEVKNKINDFSNRITNMYT